MARHPSDSTCAQVRPRRGAWHFDFEAAAISISIGAVVAVLLQGRLLDRDEAASVPPSLWRALQALDVWLAVVFVLVVGAAIAIPFVALTNGRPLQIGDRRTVAHLLFVAGACPALIAILRRTLPILYASAPDGAPRVRWPVLLIPLLGLPTAMGLVAALLRSGAPFGGSLLLIGLAGLVIGAPAIVAEPLTAWQRRRRLRDDPAQRATSVPRSAAKPG